MADTTTTGALLWTAEYTDTFGGEANYCWVKRATFELPLTANRRQIVSAGKAALGLTGVRCRTSDYSEGYELRPIGSCTVAFILPSY